MAINRLFNSLNAGAPDLRLSGDQTQRGTYTQRRRGIMTMAEGGTIAGGHQIGTPMGNRTGFGNPFGYSDTPTTSYSSSNSGGGGGPHYTDPGPAHLSHHAPAPAETPTLNIPSTKQLLSDYVLTSDMPEPLPPMLGDRGGSLNYMDEDYTGEHWEDTSGQVGPIHPELPKYTPPEESEYAGLDAERQAELDKEHYAKWIQDTQYPQYTGKEDLEGEREVDRAFALEKGLIKIDNQGNDVPGPNERDLTTGEIVPRKTTTLGSTGTGTGTGETNVPGTPIVPVGTTDTGTTTDIADEGYTTEADKAAVDELGIGSDFPVQLTAAANMPYQASHREDIIDPRLKRDYVENVQSMVDQRLLSAHGGRAGYDRGGIAGLRQPFIFGGVGDAVGGLLGKAAKGVKKIAKSPIGKAALLAGLGYFGTTGAGGFPKIFGEGTGGFWQKFNPMRLLDKNKGLNKVLASLNIDETAYKKLPIADKLKIMEAAKKVKGGTGMMDYAMMAGIPLTMAGVADYTAKTNREAEQEEQDKLLAGLKGETEKWRKQYGTSIPIEQEDFIYPAYGAAQGGRIGYQTGKSVYDDDDEDTLRASALAALYKMRAAKGGRIKYAGGGDDPQAQLEAAYKKYKKLGGKLSLNKFIPLWAKGGMAQGGRIKYQEGGLMNLGGMEKDYRQEGGFVPIGGEEKADDVPARLSKNEFVFTADAVRAAGGGDIDQGAEVMENVMENLEAGGKISEDSQGLEGARDMFANAQQLEKRII